MPKPPPPPNLTAEASLQAVAAQMAKLNITMLTTLTSRVQLSTRPMSNNGDVAYDSNSYYFTYDG